MLKQEQRSKARLLFTPLDYQSLSFGKLILVLHLSQSVSISFSQFHSVTFCHLVHLGQRSYNSTLSQFQSVNFLGWTIAKQGSASTNHVGERETDRQTDWQSDWDTVSSFWPVSASIILYQLLWTYINFYQSPSTFFNLCQHLPTSINLSWPQ